MQDEREAVCKLREKQSARRKAAGPGGEFCCKKRLKRGNNNGERNINVRRIIRVFRLCHAAFFMGKEGEGGGVNECLYVACACTCLCMCVYMHACVFAMQGSTVRKRAAGAQ